MVLSRQSFNLSLFMIKSFIDMYKRLLIIALFLLFSGVAFAQEQQDPWIWPDDHIEDALFLRIDRIELVVVWGWRLTLLFLILT